MTSATVHDAYQAWIEVEIERLKLSESMAQAITAAIDAEAAGKLREQLRKMEEL